MWAQQIGFNTRRWGDTINVASRLEGMNKTYGTSILASAEVKARCSERILFRPVGLGQAKGRHTEIELFEVIGLSPAPRLSHR
jgi:adenylate cyclase